MRAVPINRKVTVVRERTMIPTDNTIMQAKRVNSIPYLTASHGAARANRANAIRGKVVSIPASV
ncbi:hypothetical protein D3C75_1388260 [compost metagenome]